MKTQTIEIRHSNPYCTQVWLNRPDVRNAFNDQVIAELTQAFQQIAQDPQVRVVVLAAHGKAFCAGADLNWMRDMAGYSWEENKADAQALADMLWTLDQCPVPIVGRLQGDCYAGGMGLAAVCDVLVAVDSMNFCLSEARLGLMPATISPYVIRAMGAQAARRYMVTAGIITAIDAHRLGFVHQVTSADQIDEVIDSFIQILANNGTNAVKACKQLVKDVTGRLITQELRAETAKRIADIRVSDEGKEGLQSFLNKRKPNWVPSSS
ncbi:MAG: enoyl-CoA hydratase/isomerase family protein [Limnohabitans sp.]|nr:enoyl-CoA hydratase/isomerase family protein [Limnohabitans sp.]